MSKALANLASHHAPQLFMASFQAWHWDDKYGWVGGGGGGGGRNIFKKKREYTDKFSGSMDVSGNAVCHSIDINLMKVVCLQM